MNNNNININNTSIINNYFNDTSIINNYFNNIITSNNLSIEDKTNIISLIIIFIVLIYNEIKN